MCPCSAQGLTCDNSLIMKEGQTQAEHVLGKAWVSHIKGVLLMPWISKEAKASIKPPIQRASQTL